MDRREELDRLEEEIRASADYYGYRDPQHKDHDRANEALYLGLCVRELCDTLVSRLEAS